MRRLWATHLASLVAFVGWAAADPLFEPTVGCRSVQAAIEHVGWVRVLGVAAVAVLGGTSLLVMIVRLFGSARWQRPAHRSIRQFLAITAVVAIWLSLVHHHETIAWQGKRIRFAWRLDEFEAIVEPLRTGWPDRDGELSGIGPFMAYPFGEPTTLVLLQAPRVKSRSVYVSAIERGERGVIKLELTGDDGGVWAEWHPPESRPASFVGGLAEPHELRNAASLGHGWYLVRYSNAEKSGIRSPRASPPPSPTFRLPRPPGCSAR